MVSHLTGQRAVVSWLRWRSRRCCYAQTGSVAQAPAITR